MSECAAVPKSAEELLGKTAGGAGWIVCWRVATRLVGFVSTLFLIRLLLPGDFGLVALGTSLAQTVEGLAEFGIQDAVLREKSPERAIYDTAFTLNLIRSVVTALALSLCAWPIGRFFGDPRLAEVTFALALATFFDGFTNIGIIDFRRDFAFEKEFKLQVMPRLVSVVVAIGSAWVWQSYWALIAGIITNRLLRVAASYMMHPYRPRLGLRTWRSLFHYSRWAWVISMVMLIRDRMDSFVIGRMLTPSFVGIYSIGAEVAALPTTELVAPLCRAAFSGFAEARRSELSVGEIYLRVVGAISLITIPAGVGIALIAEPLVHLAFGPRWLEAIPVVRLLGLAGSVAAIGLIAATMLGVYAKLYQAFRAVVIGLGVRIGLVLLLTWRFGLAGAAMGAAISMAIENVVMTMTGLRHAGLRMRDLAACLWRPLLASAVMAAGLIAELQAGLASAYAALFLLCASGALIYSVVLLALWSVSGRLDGPERDFLTLVTRATSRATGRLAGAGRTFRRRQLFVRSRKPGW